MDFEGVIPSGYGAGEVEIWEKGTLILDERTPDLVRFHVDEGKIKGYWLLMRQDGTKWLLSSDVQLSVDKTKEIDSILTKEEISTRFNEIAERMKGQKGVNEFKMRAYKTASGIVTSLADFEFLPAEQLLQIPGLGEALVKKISDFRETGTTKLLEELRATTELRKRYPHADVLKIAEALVSKLRERFPGSIIEVAGSLRRGKDPKDIDILIAGDEKEGSYAEFCRGIGKGLDLGERSLAIIKDGIQVDLRVIPKKAYGAGMLFFTGSAEFNIRCRAKAKTLGMHLTRYGLEDLKTGDMIAQGTEKEIFDALGITWLEPKDRS